MLRIMANSENFNIFGTPLMQGYYVVFDADNHRIGFGPSSNSDKPTPVTGSQPTGLLEMETAASNWPSILLLGFIGLCLAFVWGFFIIPAMGNLVAQIVSSFAFATAVIVGEYYLDFWMVTENVFGFGTRQGQELRYTMMVAYAAVVGGAWWAVMRSLERSKQE